MGIYEEYTAELIFMLKEGKKPAHLIYYELRIKYGVLDKTRGRDIIKPNRTAHRVDRRNEGNDYLKT